MDKNEIMSFLRENLKLEYEVTGGVFDSKVDKEVKLVLCGDVISSVYLDE